MPNNVIGVPSTESINDLNDVNVTTPAINDTLCWNGTNFVNVPKSNQDQSLTEHTDVTLTAVADGETLCYDSASGQWVNVPKQAPFVLDTIGDHTDVTLTTPADNDTLCFDSASGQWVNVPKATGIPAHSITDHTDVNTAGVTDNQVLCYDDDTSTWVPVDKENQPQALDDHTDVVLTTPAANDQLCFDGTNWVNVPKANQVHSIDDHDDVTLTAIVDGQQLCWDAATSMWVNVDKETNKCCLPDPGGLTVLDPVYIDAAGVVTPSDISDPNTVAQFVVVSTDGTEVCIQDFGVVTLPNSHGFAVGDCVYEDAAGGTTTTEPTTGINNVLFHAISATKVSISAGTRPFEVGGAATPDDLDDLADVVITSPVEGDKICYDAASGTWTNQQPAGGAFVGFRATNSTFQTISFFTDVQFNTVKYDTNNGYNAATGEYTIPVTGYWDIGAWLDVESLQNQSSGYIILREGVSTNLVKSSFYGEPIANEDDRVHININTHEFLTAGDVIKVVGVTVTGNFRTDSIQTQASAGFYAALMGV